MVAILNRRDYQWGKPVSYGRALAEKRELPGRPAANGVRPPAGTKVISHRWTRMHTDKKSGLFVDESVFICVYLWLFSFVL
jgi:hypothetical protein